MLPSKIYEVVRAENLDSIPAPPSLLPPRQPLAVFHELFFAFKKFQQICILYIFLVSSVLDSMYSYSLLSSYGPLFFHSPFAI